MNKKSKEIVSHAVYSTTGNIIGVVMLSPVIKRELAKYTNAINKKEEAIEDGAIDVNDHM
mgnify:CR=1 FL=1